MKILVFGLPGSGKTTFADDLKDSFLESGKTVQRFNADVIRKQYNDWDFSLEGRIRQANRMLKLSLSSVADISIVDFVAPTENIRSLFYDSHILIWMNTIKLGRFEDTNKIFELPTKFNYEIYNFYK